ncbi:MAG TPA: M23 family metallopeptidase, partial [Chloroflexota bacterium]|nr:M23 family metallopeptidase [Chloroflexota bacterium]
PGADLNVGYGDEDLGLDVVCFADGVVAERLEWDGETYGLGNVGLVEHRLFGGGGPEGGSEGESEGGVRLWSLYAHLDGFDEGFVPGARLAAGQRVGACGKSGFQAWAHLHFELRYRGPAEGMTAAYWGGRLSYEAQSERYADPYTVLRVLEGAGVFGAAEDLVARLARLALTEHELRVTRIDRERNYQLKMEMEMEACWRRLEGAKRVRRGTTERLIKKVIG